MHCAFSGEKKKKFRVSSPPNQPPIYFSVWLGCTVPTKSLRLKFESILSLVLTLAQQDAACEWMLHISLKHQDWEQILYAQDRERSWAGLPGAPSKDPGNHGSENTSLDHRTDIVPQLPGLVLGVATPSFSPVSEAAPFSRQSLPHGGFPSWEEKSLSVLGPHTWKRTLSHAPGA